MDQELPEIVEDGKGPILHVAVIGFHHKKGCQVEYSYPPLIEGDKVDSHECPEDWKHLPSLALPDGSHNYNEDTIYFVMPSKEVPGRTVFCVSCYRQMDAENLLNRSADITRGTVQKSVCVISTLPLFGLIQAKLELITHAYFDERDFSKVSLLQETFRSLNSCLSPDLVSSQQVFLAMPVRDLVVHFKHKVLLLFKLVLLEKKVLVFKTPVKYLCSTILSLLSLFPGMIESGLTEAANVVTNIESLPDVVPESAMGDQHRLPASDELDLSKARYSPGCEMKSNLDADTPENRNKTEFDASDDKSQKNKENRLQSPLHRKGTVPNACSTTSTQPKSVRLNDAKIRLPASSDEAQLISEIEDLLDNESKEKVDLTRSKLEFHCRDVDTADDEIHENDELGSTHDSETSLASKDSLASNEGSSKISAIKGRVFGALTYWTGRNSVPLTNPEQVDGLSASATNEKIADDPENLETSKIDDIKTPSLSEVEFIPPTSPIVVINMSNEECGFPLSIFSKGVLCHPYLSLPYLDLLSDSHVRSFLVGATNVLFKQKQQLSDVIVEVDEGKIEIHDLELRKQLHLTTEDLRFADYLVRHVVEDKEDVFLDGTGWEGSDEWLRAQFKYYLVCLLRTSLLEDVDKSMDAFNPAFIEAWKGTSSYRMWKHTHSTALLDITPGHPFQGQMGMADMKLRLSHTMQSTERGRRINQAMTNTGRAVAQTSKAVGGAITQAKSAVSSWLLTFSGTPAAVTQQQQTASQ